jgi:hypothetical protein
MTLLIAGGTVVAVVGVIFWCLNSVNKEHKRHARRSYRQTLEAPPQTDMAFGQCLPTKRS